MRSLLAAALLLCVCATDAAAHTRSQSQSRWVVEGDALGVTVEADAVDVTRLYALGGEASLAEMMAQEAAQGFVVEAAGEQCSSAGEPAVRLTEGGRAVAALRFECPAGALQRGQIEIESRLFIRVAPSHLHFAALRDGAGRTAEAVLTESHPRAELSLARAPGAAGFGETVVRFLSVGAEHVWTGLDHVAFILALVLLSAGAPRSVVLAATGFTIGHTLTLGLAALDVIAPDGPAIEALIGFTIAFVALEAGAGGHARMRAWSGPIAGALALGGALALAGWVSMSPLVWLGLAVFAYAYPRGFPRGAGWLALTFGLIHGCGFAGAMAELDLPRARLIASLMGFNLGVEFGQLAVIAAALSLALLARRVAPTWIPPTWIPLGARLSGAALFALGIYWFAGRLMS